MRSPQPTVHRRTKSITTTVTLTIWPWKKSVTITAIWPPESVTVTAMPRSVSITSGSTGTSSPASGKLTGMPVKYTTKRAVTAGNTP